MGGDLFLPPWAGMSEEDQIKAAVRASMADAEGGASGGGRDGDDDEMDADDQKKPAAVEQSSASASTTTTTTAAELPPLLDAQQYQQYHAELLERAGSDFSEDVAARIDEVERIIEALGGGEAEDDFDGDDDDGYIEADHNDDNGRAGVDLARLIKEGGDHADVALRSPAVRHEEE